MLQLLKKTYTKISFLLLSIADSSKLLAIIYSLSSASFIREQLAVIHGRKIFYQTLKDPKKSNAQLRRNIHRLEKGLIMRPRKRTFGSAYIRETVDLYRLSLNVSQAPPKELHWANNVLTAYFKIVEHSHKEITKAYSQFIKNPVANYEEEMVPYKKQERLKNTITYDELMNLCLQRRSTRWFIDKQVPAKSIKKAIDLAVQAPSACNRRPYEIIAALQPDRATEICNLAMGTSGFSHNINAVLIIVGDLSKYVYDRDRHIIYIDSSLMSMQLMLALETLGLSSCPINWPDIEKREKALAKELDLPINKRPIMMIAVGYADPEGKIPYSQKLDSDDVLTVLD